MTPESGMFTVAARALHWLMAVAIIAMLFIGVGMVASVSQRHDHAAVAHSPATK